MTKQNDFILKALNVVSWIIFIGLCVEAGALIFNFILTLFKPIASNNIYKGLNLSGVYEKQFLHYLGLMSFIVALSLLKAYLFYLVVKMFMRLNLVKPFNVEMAGLIHKISLETFAIAIVSFIAHQYAKRLSQSGYEINNAEKYWDDASAFLMMASILFVISQVFKKGIELQSDNDLTI